MGPIQRMLFIERKLDIKARNCRQTSHRLHIRSLGFQVVLLRNHSF